jgi:hypothetical protein
MPGTEIRQITVTETIMEISKYSNGLFLKWLKDAVVGVKVKAWRSWEGIWRATGS